MSCTWTCVHPSGHTYIINKQNQPHIYRAYVVAWQTGSGPYYPNRIPNSRGPSIAMCVSVCPQSFPLTYASESGHEINKAKSMLPIMFINLIM